MVYARLALSSASARWCLQFEHRTPQRTSIDVLSPGLKPWTMNTTSTYLFTFAFALCYVGCSSDGDEPPDGMAGSGNTTNSRGGSSGSAGNSAGKGGSSTSKGGSSAGYAGSPVGNGG